MKFVLVLGLLASSYLSFLAGLLGNSPIYDSSISSLPFIPKMKLKMEITMAEGGGAKAFFELVEKTRKELGIFLYLKDSMIDKFLADQEIRPKFLTLYGIEDRDKPKPAEAPPAPVPPPKPKPTADEFMEQMDKDMNKRRALKQKRSNHRHKAYGNNHHDSPHINKKFGFGEARNSRTAYNRPTRERELYDVKPGAINLKTFRASSLKNRPRKLGTINVDKTVGQIYLEAQPPVISKTRARIIKDMLKYKNTGINMTLTPQQIQYLYSLPVDNKVSTPEEQDKTVLYGARLCKSELQKNLYYNLLSSIEYKRLKRPLIASLPVIAGMWLLKQPKKDWVPRIAEKKEKVKAVIIEMRENVEQNLHKHKNIDTLIESLEAYISEMSFNLISKTRTLGAIAWQKLYLPDDNAKHAEEPEEEERDGDPADAKETL